MDNLAVCEGPDEGGGALELWGGVGGCKGEGSARTWELGHVE